MLSALSRLVIGSPAERENQDKKSLIKKIKLSHYKGDSISFLTLQDVKSILTLCINGEVNDIEAIDILYNNRRSLSLLNLDNLKSYLLKNISEFKKSNCFFLAILYPYLSVGLLKEIYETLITDLDGNSVFHSLLLYKEVDYTTQDRIIKQFVEFKDYGWVNNYSFVWRMDSFKSLLLNLREEHQKQFFNTLYEIDHLDYDIFYSCIEFINDTGKSVYLEKLLTNDKIEDVYKLIPHLSQNILLELLDEMKQNIQSSTYKPKYDSLLNISPLYVLIHIQQPTKVLISNFFEIYQIDFFQIRRYSLLVAANLSEDLKVIFKEDLFNYIFKFIETNPFYLDEDVVAALNSINKNKLVDLYLSNVNDMNDSELYTHIQYLCSVADADHLDTIFHLYQSRINIGNSFDFYTFESMLNYVTRCYPSRLIDTNYLIKLLIDNLPMISSIRPTTFTTTLLKKLWFFMDDFQKNSIFEFHAGLVDAYEATDYYLDGDMLFDFFLAEKSISNTAFAEIFNRLNNRFNLYYGDIDLYNEVVPLFITRFSAVELYDLLGLKDNISWFSVHFCQMLFEKLPKSYQDELIEVSLNELDSEYDNCVQIFYFFLDPCFSLFDEKAQRKIFLTIKEKYPEEYCYFHFVFLNHSLCQDIVNERFQLYMDAHIDNESGAYNIRWLFDFFSRVSMEKRSLLFQKIVDEDKLTSRDFFTNDLLLVKAYSFLNAADKRLAIKNIFDTLNNPDINIYHFKIKEGLENICQHHFDASLYLKEVLETSSINTTYAFSLSLKFREGGKPNFVKDSVTDELDTIGIANFSLWKKNQPTTNVLSDRQLSVLSKPT